MADFAYSEREWQFRAPLGGDGGCRASGAGREFPGLGPGTGAAPPILFSLSCQRKENAPCTVEEKREALWSSRKRTPFIGGTGRNLMRGRTDFLLFPRFAPGLHRAGRQLLLPTEAAPDTAENKSRPPSRTAPHRFLPAELVGAAALGGPFPVLLCTLGKPPARNPPQIPDSRQNTLWGVHLKFWCRHRVVIRFSNGH